MSEPRRRWPKELVDVLGEIQEGICYICGKPITEPFHAVLDHIVPLSADLDDIDLDEIENLAIAHWACNSWKATRGIYDVWRCMETGDRTTGPTIFRLDAAKAAYTKRMSKVIYETPAARRPFHARHWYEVYDKKGAI